MSSQLPETKSIVKEDKQQTPPIPTPKPSSNPNFLEYLFSSYQNIQSILYPTLSTNQRTFLTTFFSSLQSQLTTFNNIVFQSLSSSFNVQEIINQNAASLSTDIGKLLSLIKNTSPLITYNNQTNFTIEGIPQQFNDQIICHCNRNCRHNSKNSNTLVMNNASSNEIIKPVAKKQGNKLVRNNNYNITTGEIASYNLNNCIYARTCNQQKINQYNNKKKDSHSNQHKTNPMKDNLNLTEHSERLLSPKTNKTIRVAKSPKVDESSFLRLMRPTKASISKRGDSKSKEIHNQTQPDCKLNKSASAKSVLHKCAPPKSIRAKIYDTLGKNSLGNTILDYAEFEEKTEKEFEKNGTKPSNYAKYLVKKYKDVVEKFEQIDNEETVKNGKKENNIPPEEISKKLIHSINFNSSHKNNISENINYFSTSQNKIFRTWRLGLTSNDSINQQKAKNDTVNSKIQVTKKSKKYNLYTNQL